MWPVKTKRRRNVQPRAKRRWDFWPDALKHTSPAVSTSGSVVEHAQSFTARKPDNLILTRQIKLAIESSNIGFCFFCFLQRMVTFFLLLWGFLSELQNDASNAFNLTKWSNGILQSHFWKYFDSDRIQCSKEQCCKMWTNLTVILNIYLKA